MVDRCAYIAAASARRHGFRTVAALSADPPPEELLEIAGDAARAAAALLLDRFGHERLLATKSSATDPVSEADLLAEAAIRDVLARRVPQDSIAGEEGADVAGTSARRWIVDPIDGTVNFLYGHPQWCVSVACEGIVGVILDPVRDELFAADARGATLNGRAIGGPPARPLEHALVATGFGYEPAVREQQARTVARLLPVVRDIRRAGSAALDLAWLAAGRVDVYYERGVKEWDTAAGTVICRAAGLRVVDLPGVGGQSAGILAGPEALVRRIRPFLTS